MSVIVRDRNNMKLIVFGEKQGYVYYYRKFEGLYQKMVAEEFYSEHPASLSGWRHNFVGISGMTAPLSGIEFEDKSTGTWREKTNLSLKSAVLSYSCFVGGKEDEQKKKSFAV